MSSFLLNSIEEVEKEKEKEMPVENVFRCLHLQEKSAISLEPSEENYVIDVASQKSAEDDCLIATVNSNKTIQLFTRPNLISTGAITGHKDTLTGLCWANSDYNVLFSSSLDKTLRAWDVRTNLKKAVQIFQGADDCNNLFNCVDINKSDQVLTAGLEADKSENAYIFFWDRRSTELLGCYSESHQDDITQVRFHPENPDMLSTGSMDGLVCVFDISQTDEDDALLYALNSCSHVSKIGWCGSNLQHIYCTTHIDTVLVWDSEEGDPVLEITNLKDSMQEKDSIEYLLDCVQFSEESGLTLLAGNHNGDIRIIECTTKNEYQPNVLNTLHSHKSTVRCSHWDPKRQNLVTGAEDSMLCLWSCTDKDFPVNAFAKLKVKKEKKRSAPY